MVSKPGLHPSQFTIQSCQSCYSYDFVRVEYNDDFFRHLTNGFIFGVQAILHWSFFGSARGNKIQGDPEISAKVSNNLREIALSFFCIVGRGLRHGVKLHCQRARICVILSLVPVPHSEWGNFFTPVNKILPEYSVLISQLNWNKEKPRITTLHY